jgi:hypothetical protein
MKVPGPIVTLFVGAALAGGLYGANLAVTAQDDVDSVAVDTAAPSEEPSAEPTDAATAPAAGAQEGGGGATPTQTPFRIKKAAWGGKVDGGAASIAIVVRNGVAIGYICDGKKLEAWLAGTAVDGRLLMEGKQQASLDGIYGEGRAKGTVSVRGKEFTFNVGTIKKGSGLYRTTARVGGTTIKAGWIELPDGTQVGAYTTNGGESRPAPRLTTKDGTGTAVIDGSPVTATEVDAETGAGF